MYPAKRLMLYSSYPGNWLSEKDMNLRHWQHFLKVAETGSFSRASERLGVGQPVLSREMRGLEEAIGTTLFRRHGRGVALTAAGEMFRRRADNIIQQISRVPADVVSTAKEPSGTLWLAFPPSISGLISIHAIAKFRRAFPAVRLRIREGTSIQIRDALLAREAELGIVSLPLSEPQLALDPLFSEPMMLIGAPNKAVPTKRAITIRHLASLPLILGTKPNSPRVLLEQAMEAAGMACNPVIETDAMAIASLVSHGLGYSVAPACYTIGRWPKPLALGPIKGLRIAWAMANLRGSEASVAAQRMREIVKQLVVEATLRVSWSMQSLVTDQKQ
jgi:LysR family transcriptional regulator, nitrogen assimilation regulatory protein